MRAIYRKEESGLRIRRILLPFLVGHARNLLKRLFYNYYLRGFSAGSIELLLALILLPFGVSMGLVEWSRSIATGRVASSGTVMLAALPIILGFQLLLSFIAEDIQNLPRTPISPNL
jgi:hypothetical protein